jgi:hypothetical protein
MKQLVLEKIVVSGFPPVNKRCLWLKGNTFYYWYKGAWRSIDSEVDIDSDYIDNKVTEVVSETIGEEISKVIGSAPAEYDTLGEVVDHIQNHEAESEERDAQLNEHAAAIQDINEKITTLDPTGSGWNEVS